MDGFNRRVVVMLVATLLLASCADTTQRQRAEIGVPHEFQKDTDLSPAEIAGLRKDLQCNDGQQRESSTAVQAACAFDQGAAAEQMAQVDAENEVTRDYTLAVDKYMSDPVMRAYVNELRDLPQPERAQRGQYLLDYSHVIAQCAFDNQHPADYSHQTSYVMTVDCEPAKSGTPP